MGKNKEVAGSEIGLHSALHVVECRPSLEPLNLFLVECVVEHNGVLGLVWLGDDQCQGIARGKGGESFEAHGVL